MSITSLVLNLDALIMPQYEIQGNKSARLPKSDPNLDPNAGERWGTS
jgi:hypothetical protein